MLKILLQVIRSFVFYGTSTTEKRVGTICLPDNQCEMAPHKIQFRRFIGHKAAGQVALTHLIETLLKSQLMHDYKISITRQKQSMSIIN